MREETHRLLIQAADNLLVARAILESLDEADLPIEQIQSARVDLLLRIQSLEVEFIMDDEEENDPHS